MKKRVSKLVFKLRYEVAPHQSKLSDIFASIDGSGEIVLEDSYSESEWEDEIREDKDQKI